MAWRGVWGEDGCTLKYLMPFRTYFTTLLVLLLANTAWSLTADDMLAKVDTNMVFDSRSATALMRIHTTDGINEKKMKLYNSGLDKASAEFLEPPRDKGVKYLKSEKNLWMFMPTAGRTIKISGHMLRQSMMGSDMSYEDSLENPRLQTDYTAELLPDETLEGKTVHVLKLTAKTSAQAYAGQKLWIDPQYWLPVKVEKYASTGKLLKRQSLGDIKAFGNRNFPLYYKMEDTLRNSGGTEFILSNVKFSVALPETTFSLRALERQ